MATTLRFDADGSVAALLGDGLDWLADEGRVQRRRASHVVPERYVQRLAFRLLRAAVCDEGRAAAWTRTWRCRWLADLAPSGGPRLGPFLDRRAAIEAELDWLRTHRAL